MRRPIVSLLPWHLHWWLRSLRPRMRAMLCSIPGKEVSRVGRPPTRRSSTQPASATLTAQSMLMDNLGGGFRNDVGVATVTSGSAYDAWSQAGNRIAAGDLDVALEFDFTFDHSLSGVQPGQFVFAQLAMFVNSTDVPPGSGGFKQYGTGSFLGGNIDVDFPSLAAAAVADGVTMTGVGNTRHLRIPMNAARGGVGWRGPNRWPTHAGSFYQVGFKSNGGWTGTVDWAIDNMRVTGANIPEPAQS